MSTSLQPPQLIVNQRFAGRPAGTQRSLQPFVIGGLAHLIRYGDEDERPNGYIGVYDDAPSVVEGVAQSLFSWPNLPVGNEVDIDYVKLFVEGGLFRYFRDSTETATINGSRNKIRLPSNHLRNNPKGADVSDVIDGGVANGDVVLVSGVNTSAEPFSLASYVIGTQGDIVASSVGVPSPASSNQASQAAGATVTEVTGNSGDLSAVASAAAYQGAATGHVTETYTVEVIVAGAAGSAKLRVSSLSGTDDVASVTTAALDSATAIGSRGATATFSADGGSAFVLGDTWTIAVVQEIAAATASVTGTYTGKFDRTYIAEVITGGVLGTDSVQVAVSSQDGTDSVALQTTTGDEFSLGSYGLTLTLASTSDDLVKGDKFVIGAKAAGEGAQRTLVLAHNLPSNVATDATADLTISLYKQYDMEVPRKSYVAGQYNWTAEATQIRVRGDIELKRSDVTLSGSQIAMEMASPSEVAGVNRLYVEMRSWYPRSSDIFSISSDSDLDVALQGPTHPDNPLKYAISLARISAVGETIHGYNVGDDSDIDNWTAGFTAAGRSEATYGYVPVTQDVNVLLAAQSAVSTANASNRNMYRVLWASAPQATGGVVLDATTTSDETQALATVGDDATATGTQYTLFEITSGNADLVDLAVRPGDRVRFLFSVDAWGDETYVEKTIADVRSAVSFTVTEAFSSDEVVPRRVEIHRTYQEGELRDYYANQAAQYGSDLVRCVIAPTVHIGSYELGAHFLTPILAGMRASQPAQQPLSTYTIPGVARISGFESLGEDSLNRIAGSGGYICYFRFQDSSVRIRHAVTTGDTDVLAKREESMVSARHAALFVINSRLAVYAGRSNLGDADSEAILEEQIRSELKSIERTLQDTDFEPNIGGLIVDLEISDIGPSGTQADEMIINGSLGLGRPNNRVTFNVSIG